MGLINKHFDVAVIGLGVYGSAVTWQLAKRGVKVVGIDRFDPPHTNGSSHGGTRISRFATFEGKAYVASAIETAAMYQSLQAEPKIAAYLQREYNTSRLFTPNGTLVMGPTGSFNKKAHNIDNAVAQTITFAQDAGIAHELLDGHDIVRRFPAFRIAQKDRAETIGYHESGSGTLFPERCVDAQLQSARLAGAKILTHREVTDIRLDSTAKTLTMVNGDGDAEKLRADRIVICAGAWVSSFLPEEYARQFDVQRQVLGWYPSRDAKDFSIQNHPNYIRFVRTANGSVDYFYGFPSNERDPVKVARENGVRIGGDQKALRQTWEGELDSLYGFVKPYLKGIKRKGAFSAACRYTKTLNEQFHIALHPYMPDTTVVSACSGYGFKHALSIGAALAAEMQGETQSVVDLKSFGWEAPVKFDFPRLV